MESRLVLLGLIRVALTGEWSQDLATEPVDWGEIRKIASEQTVAGLVFDAINTNFERIQMPQQEAMKWIALSQSIAKRNKQLNVVLAQVVRSLGEAGIESILLKGQGCAQYYSNPLSRTPGDIDIYVGPDNFDRATDILLAQGVAQAEGHRDIKHVQLEAGNVSIEVHKHVDFLPGRKQNKLMQQAAYEALRSSSAGYKLEDVFVRTLPPALNTAFTFIHMFRHFVGGGITLRQVIDWDLLSCQLDDQSEVERYLNEFGFMAPWGDFVAVALEYLRPFAVDKPNQKDDGRTAQIMKHLFDDSKNQRDSIKKYGIVANYTQFFRLIHIYPSFSMKYLLRLINSQATKHLHLQ